MNVKEVLAQFKAAPWKSDADIEAFAVAADELKTADVLKLLESLSGGPATERAAHRWRCQALVKLAERAPDKSLFPHYVRALKTGDPDLRAALARLLPGVNNVAEHPALVALLRSSDAGLRLVASEVLSQLGGRTVFELLEAMVQEPGFAGRNEALDVLTAKAPHHAIPALQSVLAVGNPAEKGKAIGLLLEPRCHAKDPAAAAAALAVALRDPTESIVVRAIAGLSTLATEDVYLAEAAPTLESSNLTLVKAAVDGLKSFSSTRVMALLERSLRRGPNVIRLAALDALEGIGTSDVVPPLAEALGHPHLGVRTRAAEALSRLSLAGKIDLARTVIWLLRSRDVNVRRMAAEIAQSVRDPDGELWPKLLGYLRDEDWWVRERVMDALVDMAGDGLVAHLAAYLQDPSDVVRRWGVDAFMRLKSPAALGSLVRRATDDPDWWVRERAIAAIAVLKDPRTVPHLVDIMLRNPLLQVTCLQALEDMEAHEAAPHVAALLASEDPDIQVAALRCLRALDDPGQSASVQPLVKDANPEVRGLARDLVLRWGAGTVRESVPTVVQAIPLLDQLLIAMARMEGDDLILAPGRRPFVKSRGKVLPLAKNVFSAERVRSLLLPHLSAKQMEALGTRHEVDFSYRSISENMRFRVNVFHQIGGLGAVFRIIKGTLPDIETLGLPPAVRRLADLANGLVLVGGPTGSGKSTTLAALVDHVNRTAKRHVISLEDPIEFLHPRKMCLVNQREVGTHTGSFAEALRSTLREDPDVILVGEMRDLPTISFAVTAAETGHLVFGTIHTVSAAGTVDRLVNAFPAGRQDHVRSMLAGSLRAVVCQYLHQRRDVSGRCLSVEVMLNSDAVANLIRKGKTFQLSSVIATSREQGMQLMDGELMRLVKEGKISADDAYAKAVSKKEFEALAGGELTPPVHDAPGG